MQKCLGEILDEENDQQQTINQNMADKNTKSGDTPLSKISEPINDLGKYIWDNVFVYLLIYLYISHFDVLLLQNIIYLLFSYKNKARHFWVIMCGCIV